MKPLAILILLVTSLTLSSTADAGPLRHSRNVDLADAAACPGGVCPGAPVSASSHSRWTFPGTIREHLIREHHYTAEQLANLSQRQMEALHDAAHDQARGGVSVEVGNGRGVRVQVFRPFSGERRGVPFVRRVRGWCGPFGCR